MAKTRKPPPSHAKPKKKGAVKEKRRQKRVKQGGAGTGGTGITTPS